MNNKSLSTSLKKLLKESLQESKAQEYVRKLIDLTSKGEFGTSEDLLDLDDRLRKAYRTYKRGLNPISPEKKAGSIAKATQTRQDNKLMKQAGDMAAEELGLSQQERLAILLNPQSMGKKADKLFNRQKQIFAKLKNQNKFYKNEATN
jgi:hypothetical protein